MSKRILMLCLFMFAPVLGVAAVRYARTNSKTQIHRVRVG
jgi:hypothetical protein